MKTISIVISLLAVVAVFCGGYWFGIRSAKIEVRETMRIDTVFYEKPQPVKILPPTLATARVPKMLFAPQDTVIKVVSETDSLDLQVKIERKQYGDSTYRAQVSGVQIGDIAPALDWIEVYNRTNTIKQTITKRSRFAVTAGVGAAYTPQGFQPYVGVGVGFVLWQW